MVDVIIRQLQKEDLFNGFLKSLDSLKKASDIDKNKADEIFSKIKSNPNHVIFVAVLDNKVIGSTTLLIEPKFIHNGGLVGHIEDVVVSKDHQGKGVGEKLILKALEYSKEKKCYKTILDCIDEIKPFYEKLGFKVHSSGMRFDHV
jgi:glucosamine-phosphate N-acetyltransferase